MFTTSVGMLGFGILSQSLLAWSLLPEGRGALAVCVLFASLLSIIPVFSADRGAQYLVMTGKVSVSEGMALALGVCLVASVAATALAFPLIHSGLSFFEKADSDSFLLSLVLVPLISMSIAAELQLAGLRRVVALSAIHALRSVVTVSGIAILVWTLDRGVDGAILAYAASWGVSLVAALWTMRRHCGLTFAPPRLAVLRQGLGYGLRAHATRMGLEIESRLGALALGVLASGAEVGLFAAANAMVRSLEMIPGAVRAALSPRATAGTIERAEMTGLCLRLVCLTTAGAAALLLALATPLVRVLLSEAFLPAVAIIWILAPGILAGACAIMLQTYFNAIDRPEVCGLSVWLGLAAAAGAFAVLFPVLGAKSAAWATSLGLIARTVFLTVMFRRATGVTAVALWLPRRGDFVYLWAAARAGVRRPASQDTKNPTPQER